MTERDPKISRRYRELGGEEPPRTLDDAILAASRRSVQKRSWNRPIAIAAVIVLAVAVTVHVQREQPAEELVTASRAPAPAGAPPAAPPPAAQERAEAKQPTPARPRAFTPDPKPAPSHEQSAGAAADSRAGSRERRDAVSAAEVAGAKEPETAQRMMAGRAESGPKVQAVQPAPTVAAKPAPAAAAAMRRADEARASPALSKFAGHSPEQWLLAIDDLKRQGMHEEAEKQLAEFRQRYPDYRIPEAITEKFEKR